jgi:hypothetical protein
VLDNAMWMKELVHKWEESVDYKWNVSLFDFVWFPKENKYIFLNRNCLFIPLLGLFPFLNFILILCNFSSTNQITTSVSGKFNIIKKNIYLIIFDHYI